MNLKDSFRMQKYIDSLMQQAQASLADRNHAFTVTKTHLRKSANPEAEDKVEQIDAGEFFKNDDIVSFMLYLIDEKEKLSLAISKSKAACEIDIDAMVESNKYRQNLCNSIKYLFRNTNSKKIERGTDYKLTVDGTQTSYVYDIEVKSELNYDCEQAKCTMKHVIAKADEVSRQIDAAMINTIVDYKQDLFTVNDSFEDVVKAFIAEHSLPI